MLLEEEISAAQFLSASTIALCKTAQYEHYQQLFLKRYTSIMKQMNVQGFSSFLLQQSMFHSVRNSNKNHSVKCHWNALSQMLIPFAHRYHKVLPV